MAKWHEFVHRVFHTLHKTKLFFTREYNFLLLGPMIKKFLIFAQITVLLVLVSGCGGITVWGTKGGMPQRWYSANESTGNNVALVWDIGYETLALTSPVSDGENIYIVTTTENGPGVVVLDMGSGRQSMAPVLLEEAFTYELALDENYLFVTSGSSLKCFYKKTMLENWAIEFDGEEVVSMFEHKDLLYGVTNIGTAFCIHKETGVFKWKTDVAKDYVFRWVTLGERELFVTGGPKGFDYTHIFALSFMDGSILWHLEFDGPPDYPPQASAYTIFVNSRARIYAYDTRSRGKIWYYPITGLDGQPSTLGCNPCIYGDYVLVPSKSKIAKIDLKTGIEESKIIVPNTLQMRGIVASKDALFVALNGDPMLYVFDMKTGLPARKIEGKRTILGMALCKGFVIQSQEAVTLLK